MSKPESQDAYALLPFQDDRALRAYEVGGGLVFLDTADQHAKAVDIAGYLRQVPLDILGRPRWVLVRWGPEHQGWPSAHEAADELQKQLDSIGSNAKSGVIVFEIAEDPHIVWSGDKFGLDGYEAVLLNRARAIEMNAFLRWGHAIWDPETYHYVLPSGRHTGTFVRLADVFQDMRAASALATWLYGTLTPQNPTTVVMDIGTLMPLISELRHAAKRHREAVKEPYVGIGRVISLNRYPLTSMGLHRHLLNISQDDVFSMLGVVSVSDSGRLAELLLNAFSVLGSPIKRVEQVVARQPSGTIGSSVDHSLVKNTEEENIDKKNTENQLQVRGIKNPWLTFDVPEDTDSHGHSCRLCKNPDKARQVRINPQAMSAMILPEPDMIVPDIFAARQNAALWESYNSIKSYDNAVSMIGPAGTRPLIGEILTRSRPKTVFFEPVFFIKTEPGKLVSDRLEELKIFPKRNPNDKTRDRLNSTLELMTKDKASIVIYDDNERDLFEDNEWESLSETLVEHHFMSDDARWIQYSSVAGLCDASELDSSSSPEVLILAFGIRTGLTCQSMFFAGRQKLPNANFRCLAFHAHPENKSIWNSIINNFTDSSGNKCLVHSG